MNGKKVVQCVIYPVESSQGEGMLIGNHWYWLGLSFQGQKNFSFLGDTEIGNVGRKLKSSRDGNRQRGPETKKL